MSKPNDSKQRERVLEQGNTIFNCLNNSIIMQNPKIDSIRNETNKKEAWDHSKKEMPKDFRLGFETYPTWVMRVGMLFCFFFIFQKKQKKKRRA